MCCKDGAKNNLRNDLFVKSSPEINSNMSWPCLYLRCIRFWAQLFASNQNLNSLEKFDEASKYFIGFFSSVLPQLFNCCC